jgi:hypothetical protein
MGNRAVVTVAEPPSVFGENGAFELILLKEP